MTKWIFILTILISVTSQAGELKVMAGPNPTFILPSNLLSCMQLQAGATTNGVVSAPSFSLTKFQVSWNGQEALSISHILVQFEDPALVGGKYTCAIAGDELTAVFGARPEIEGGNAPSVLNASCDIRCGGVALKESGAKFLKGKITVFGSEWRADGSGSIVTSSAPIALERPDF